MEEEFKDNKYDQKYDRTSKNLIQEYDKEMIEFLVGIKINSIKPVDREINLPKKHLDSSFEIDNKYLLNLEFQVEYEKNIEERLLLYRCLLKHKYKYKKPVRSIIVYLKNSINIKSTCEEYFSTNKLKFEFDVIKVWELNLNKILEEKILSLIPFVPIIKKDENLIKIAYDIIIEAELNKEAKENLLNYMLVFSTLMYKKETIEKMLAPVEEFKKTEFFQELVKESKLEEKVEMAKRMFEKGYKTAEISNITELSEKEIKNIINKIKKK